jgi:hypothetical protein
MVVLEDVHHAAPTRPGVGAEHARQRRERGGGEHDRDLPGAFNRQTEADNGVTGEYRKFTCINGASRHA